MKIRQFSFIIIVLSISRLALSDTSSAGAGSFTVTKDSSGSTNEPIFKPIFKPTLTRAELKVSRSLNPDNMQTLNVRTNNGGIATIIVKKRDGKTSVNNEPRQAFYDVSNQFSRGEVRRGLFGPVQVLERLDDSQVQKLHQQQQFENGRVYNNWGNPGQITTLHQSQQYHRNPYDSYRFAPPSSSDQKSVNLINSFMNHVQTIESGRQSRSPDATIRNDRDQVHTRIPEPVTINSESVYVKDPSNKRGRSIMEIDSDGVPVISGIRMPDDENDKRQTWRNARVINGELVPYESGYVPPRTIEYGQLVYPVKKSDIEIRSRRKSVGPFTTADNFSEETQDQDTNKSIGPFSVTDMFSSKSGREAANGGSIGPFSVSDNSRTSNGKLIDYIKRINEQEYRKDYFNGRVPKEAGNQQKIQRRMMTQPPGNTYFPPSSRYSVGSKPNDSILVGPVLQYAHPEFGLQSAGSQYEDSQPKHNKQTSKIEYYTNSYQQKPYTNQPLYQIEPTGALNTREYYNYNKAPPATYPYNYGFIRRVKPERPFWEKISDQMRDTFQSGFAQVQDMTRPVVDPIMEAGEKISHNLGFSHSMAQEKVGSNVPSSSISSSGSSYMIPALGVLAGGAALGLGAVAMGRIFDVGNLATLLTTMRSSDEEASFEEKRALDAIQRSPSTTLYLVDSNENSINKENPSEQTNYSEPRAKFLELIAIPYQQQQSNSFDSSIEPTSDDSQLSSHQRRKRNK